MSKRKSQFSTSSSPSKRAKVTKQESDTDEEDVQKEWPAPHDRIEQARTFIRECAEGGHRVLLVPDKDADGLSSGAVLFRTLTFLGLPPSQIHTHLLSKASSLFSDYERSQMESVGASRVIVLDQGSRGGTSIVDPKGGYVRTLLLDHHFSPDSPSNTLTVSACLSPPIVTTSLLSYLTCLPLHPRVKDECAWYALLGVIGDLGQGTVKWGQKGTPWPAWLGEAEKKLGKKNLADAVSMLNAPRRTAEYNVPDAWDALLRAGGPKDLAENTALQEARSRISREVERCTHTAPKFSKDSRVALFRISSSYQVHPLIATRWAAHLKSSKLICVMVANSTYNPSNQHTHFSCRIANHLRKVPEAERPNLQEVLMDFAGRVKDLDVEGAAGWKERVGQEFARGHKEATGGVILTSDFELFTRAMEIGVKPDPDPNAPPKTPKKSKSKVIDSGQTTKLTSFFEVKDSPKKGQPKADG